MKQIEQSDLMEKGSHILLPEMIMHLVSDGAAFNIAIDFRSQNKACARINRLDFCEVCVDTTAYAVVKQVRPSFKKQSAKIKYERQSRVIIPDKAEVRRWSKSSLPWICREVVGN